jgi:hypothetical protein
MSTDLHKICTVEARRRGEVGAGLGRSVMPKFVEEVEQGSEDCGEHHADNYRRPEGALLFALEVAGRIAVEA